jgi:hypothetical protein
MTRTPNSATARMASRGTLIARFALVTQIILISGAPASCADLVGRILNSRGEPVSGIQVSVIDSAGVDAGKAVSDARGAYAITNLAPGAYQLGCNAQWVMSYIGSGGLTVNWGLAPHSPPVAVASLGTIADSSVTPGPAFSNISSAKSKPETSGSNKGSSDNRPTRN